MAIWRWIHKKNIVETIYYKTKRIELERRKKKLCKYWTDNGQRTIFKSKRATWFIQYVQHFAQIRPNKRSAKKWHKLPKRQKNYEYKHLNGSNKSNFKVHLHRILGYLTDKYVRNAEFLFFSAFGPPIKTFHNESQWNVQFSKMPWFM